MNALGQGSGGYVPDLVRRTPGSGTPTEETYVDLYEHNIRLRELTRWSLGAPLSTFGTLALGAGVGAWAAGTHITSTPVLLCLLGGAVAVICGWTLQAERFINARGVYEAFDRRLCLYDEDSTAQPIRERLERRRKEQRAERRLATRLKRRLKGEDD
jgi:hypothetical protein